MSDHDYDDDWDGNLLADGQRAYDAMKQRAEQAENALIDIRQWIESGEQHQASPKATRDAIAAVVKAYFNPT